MICVKYRSQYNAKYYATHKDKYKEYRKQYYVKHREELLYKKWVYSIKTKYGLSVRDYKNLLKHQNYRCGICCSYYKGKNVWGKLTKFHIDHDHKSGKVRGLLCNKCNYNLGWYEACQEKIKNYLKGS